MKKFRRIIQVLCTVLANGYMVGFARGTIFTGGTKVVCVPFLNCYSCPSALGACPVGALQAVLGDRNFKFSFYVLGMLMAFGILFGRIVCGFMCPFGLLQDLLYKIKTPKLNIPKKLDGTLRYVKYAVLVILVILLPLLLTDAFGTGSPYFCKWLCPAGTLEGGFPLLIANESLRNTIGFLFSFKCAILILIVGLAIPMSRPFCKYLCPLGAFYGLFNKVGFFRIDMDESKCTGCGSCDKTCSMNITVKTKCNSAECIRCGQCIDVCKSKALTMKPHV